METLKNILLEEQKEKNLNENLELSCIPLHV